MLCYFSSCIEICGKSNDKSQSEAISTKLILEERPTTKPSVRHIPSTNEQTTSWGDDFGFGKVRDRNDSILPRLIISAQILRIVKRILSENIADPDSLSTSYTSSSELLPHGNKWGNAHRFIPTKITLGSFWNSELLHEFIKRRTTNA